MKTLNVYLRAPVLMFLIVSLLLNGCAAVQVGYSSAAKSPALPVNAPQVAQEMIVSLRAGTVAYQVGQALAGKPGTQILVKGMQYVFTWSQEGVGTGMFCIDLEGKSFPDVLSIIKSGGMLMNNKAATNVVEMFKQNGWQVVTAAEVSAGLRVLLMGVLEKVATSSLTLYMIVPAGWDGKSLPWENEGPG